MATDTLTAAKRNKADEFYTQMPDIVAELKHYRDHFLGKVVFCNCDDPYESNFFKYFALNFKHLGLKKLITTCYAGSSVAGEELPLLSSAGLSTPGVPYKVVITEVPDANGDGAIDLSDVRHLLSANNNVMTRLKGDGDFRSAECIDLLKESDIVVTNPPFSLFREYVAQLVEYDKKFIVLGNQNAITYKEIFPLIKAGSLWLGNNGGSMSFKVPPHYEPRVSRYWVDEEGQKWRSFGNIYWFTNLDHAKRHQPLTLYAQYDPDKYPTYANYDAIEVSKVADIPYDYDGPMGVPITFLDKHNPEQFEIIGASRWLGKPMSALAPKGTYVQGGIRFYLREKGEVERYTRLYDRIVIKRIGVSHEH